MIGMLDTWGTMIMLDAWSLRIGRKTEEREFEEISRFRMIRYFHVGVPCLTMPGSIYSSRYCRVRSGTKHTLNVMRTRRENELFICHRAFSFIVLECVFEYNLSCAINYNHSSQQ